MRTLVQRICFLLVAVVTVNAAYLAAFDTPTIFYYANVIAHVAMGIALVLVLSLVGILAIRRQDRAGVADAGAGAPRESGYVSWFYPLVAAAMSITGLYLARTGTASTHINALRAHETAALLFLLVLLLTLRARSPRPASARVLLAIICGFVALPLAAKGYRTVRPSSPAMIVNPLLPPVTPDDEGGGKTSLFFPSSNKTVSGKLIPSDFFLESKSCGNKGCHPDITAQWESSAHHFSSFNNQWYRKSIEYMQDTIGTKPSKWCGGCHDMAILLTGRMDRPIKEQIHTPEAQAGIGCLVCHSIVHVSDTMGQGGFTIEYPEMHRLVASKNPVLRFLHDRMVFLDPAPHKATMMKAFHRASTPEFCSSCHKVHLDVPVNHYRWFRGFNDYDAWQQSGVSMQGARAFYYPDAPKKCGSCHMPFVRSEDQGNINGMVHSHRFPGANTALPLVNEDPVQFETVKKFLQDGILTVDIFAVSEEPAAFASPYGTEPEDRGTGSLGATVRGWGAAKGAIGSGRDAGGSRREAAPVAQSMFPEESGFEGSAGVTQGRGPARTVIAPIERAVVAARPGSTVQVDVVARTRKIGHFFPGGTVDAFDVWLELKAQDAQGKILYWNGWVADEGKGPVDPGAHFYRSLMLDDHGNRINKRNAWAARVAAYVRLIPPGAADTAHFLLDLPADVQGPVTLTARMNYRKFNWWNTQWSFAGVRDPAQGSYEISERYDDGQWSFSGDVSDVSGKIKGIPDLPTIVVAESTRLLSIGTNPAPPVPALADRERWNDYGIGLLLQKDYRGAAAAFEAVTSIEPGYADGWVNRARAALEEGDHLGALDHLATALRIDPLLPKARYFRGIGLRTLGRYDESLADLERAADAFPRDRVVLNAIGRVRFLKREFALAATAFKRTLAIDPEDVAAHYNLMLCYRGLGNEAASKVHEGFYTRFKADESAQSVTGAFRLLNPDENRERQAVHMHASTWTPENLEAASGARYAARPAPPSETIGSLRPTTAPLAAVPHGHEPRKAVLDPF